MTAVPVTLFAYIYGNIAQTLCQFSGEETGADKMGIAMSPHGRQKTLYPSETESKARLAPDSRDAIEPLPRFSLLVNSADEVVATNGAPQGGKSPKRRTFR